jgi:hypothetical protein
MIEAICDLSLEVALEVRSLFAFSPRLSLTINFVAPDGTVARADFCDCHHTDDVTLNSRVPSGLVREMYTTSGRSNTDVPVKKYTCAWVVPVLPELLSE